ncbi:MAG: hypothetical protein WC217_02040 [Candidatus Paceibacterota bacterium]|jgi:protein-tyrosine-phosphatase
MTKKILCVCIGNADRSPVMAAVLGMFLKNAGHDVVCESAGISGSARTGKAAPYGLAAAKKIGLDLSEHVRRHIHDVDLRSYDLIVCASDEIAGKVVEEGADMKTVYNANITNPWPVQFQEDYDAQCMPAILSGMYRIVCRYFS